MPTVRQRRVLEDMGITYWVDRASADASLSSPAVSAVPAPRARAAVAERPGAMPDALRALLQDDGADAPRRQKSTSRSPRVAAPAVAEMRDTESLPPALGCYWVAGTLLLCESNLTPEDRRFSRDLLLAGAALSTVDRASTSHRARLSTDTKPLWLTVSAAELITGGGDFTSAALGFLRKRLQTAAAQRLLLCGGVQGVAADWLRRAGQDAALSDQLDPALAALGARLGRWQYDAAVLPVFVVPPIALLRAEPARKARLWRWLLESGAS